MAHSPILIKFENSQNPTANFDLIRLEEVFTRSFTDHSPLELHHIGFYLIIFIEQGKGTHTIDFTDYDYQEGSIITVRQDQIQKFHFNPTVRGSILLFTSSFLAAYLERLESLKTFQLFNEVLGSPVIDLQPNVSEAIYEQIGRIHKEYFTKNDDYTFGIIRSELHILIAKLYRSKSKDGYMIYDRKYLEEFITFQGLVEEKITSRRRVQDYAAMMGVSTKTLNTITRSVISKTAKSFIDEIAMTQIKRLLVNTTLTVKEVAFATGFEEVPNFYKYFKRQMGKTPEGFRSEG